MGTTKMTEAYDFYRWEQGGICAFPGCEHVVAHDETALYCRWCQEAYGGSVPLNDHDLIELFDGARLARACCEHCGDVGMCSMTVHGWKCTDCQ